MSKLVSVDPGVTTGVSFISYDDDSVQLEEAFQIGNGRRGFIDFLYREIKNPSMDVETFVCEDFILRPGVHGANIEPAFIIGAMEGILENYKVNMQEAGLKKLVNDERLKKMGMFKTGWPHANDATRHGIIYLRNKKHMPTLLKGWD